MEPDEAARREHIPEARQQVRIRVSPVPRALVEESRKAAARGPSASSAEDMGTTHETAATSARCLLWLASSASPSRR